MDSAAINSFIPTLDEVDSWSEILTLLPILIILELLLSADNAIALASLTKSLDILYPHYLTFKVAKPTIARMSEIIQKRMTI